MSNNGIFLASNVLFTHCSFSPRTIFSLYHHHGSWSNHSFVLHSWEHLFLIESASVYSVSFMCSTCNFISFRAYVCMLTTKSLVLFHHAIDPFIFLPLCSDNHQLALLCICFYSVFYILCMNKIICCFSSPSDLFHLV